MATLKAVNTADSGIKPKLFNVLFTYGEHEMENDVYVGETGTPEEARDYLLYIHTNDSDDGYMQHALEDPKMLVIESVGEFKNVCDKNGKQYEVNIS